jgi:hypothetical protein
MKSKIPTMIGLLLAVTLSACSPSKPLAAKQKTSPAPKVYKVGSTYYTFDESFVKYFGTNAIPEMLNALEKSEK